MHLLRPLRRGRRIVLPALNPQVYLHYDPYTQRSGKQSAAL
ncbi:hypothetical protein [Streptomyces sp. ISL-36]|nr:hypothetical protein [Streptomyces sp. ISL-36]